VLALQVHGRDVARDGWRPMTSVAEMREHMEHMMSLEERIARLERLEQGAHKPDFAGGHHQRFNDALAAAIRDSAEVRAVLIELVEECLTIPEVRAAVLELVRREWGEMT
jgi:hypothetical protein